MTDVKSQEIYDKDYFEGKKSPYHNYGKGILFKITSFLWVVFLIILFRPKRVLDIGCATGKFVSIFRKFGIEAWGIDISEYAISIANPSIKPYLKRANAQTIIFEENYFDLVYSFDFLEHVSEEDIPKVLSECNRVTSKWMFHKINTGIMDRFYPDKTHINLKPIKWWREMFKKQMIKIKYVFFWPMTWIIISEK